MANIYLRVSNYVAAFMRSLGDGESLPPATPLTFSPYTQEYPVLVSGLRIVPEAKQHLASCYSQSAWQNMLCGRLPQGGMQILNRDSSQYLSYAEICTLERLPNKTKSEAYEFLCISLPREMVFNGRMVKVNKSYTLDTRAANQMRRLMREAFIRAFLHFEMDNRTFADGHGLDRSNNEILERFLMEHDIPVSHDEHERKSLKRLVLRWRKEAMRLSNDKRLLDDITISRIDKRELHDDEETDDDD